jgi:hypothetical protein
MSYGISNRMPLHLSAISPDASGVGMNDVVKSVEEEWTTLDAITGEEQLVVEGADSLLSHTPSPKSSGSLLHTNHRLMPPKLDSSLMLITEGSSPLSEGIALAFRSANGSTLPGVAFFS